MGAPPSESSSAGATDTELESVVEEEPTAEEPIEPAPTPEPIAAARVPTTMTSWIEEPFFQGMFVELWTFESGPTRVRLYERFPAFGETPLCEDDIAPDALDEAQDEATLLACSFPDVPGLHFSVQRHGTDLSLTLDGENWEEEFAIRLGRPRTLRFVDEVEQDVQVTVAVMAHQDAESGERGERYDATRVYRRRRAALVAAGLDPAVLTQDEAVLISEIEWSLNWRGDPRGRCGDGCRCPVLQPDAELTRLLTPFAADLRWAHAAGVWSGGESSDLRYLRVELGEPIRLYDSSGALSCEVPLGASPITATCGEHTVSLRFDGHALSVAEDGREPVLFQQESDVAMLGRTRALGLTGEAAVRAEAGLRIATRFWEREEHPTITGAIATLDAAMMALDEEPSCSTSLGEDCERAALRRMLDRRTSDRVFGCAIRGWEAPRRRR